MWKPNGDKEAGHIEWRTLYVPSVWTCAPMDDHLTWYPYLSTQCKTALINGIWLGTSTQNPTPTPQSSWIIHGTMLLPPVVNPSVHLYHLHIAAYICTTISCIHLCYHQLRTSVLSSDYTAGLCLCYNWIHSCIHVCYYQITLLCCHHTTCNCIHLCLQIFLLPQNI